MGRVAHDRLPGRRRARRPGPDDRARARADRRRRRDRPRPADPRDGAGRRAPGRRADLRRQGGRRRVGAAGRDRAAAGRARRAADAPSCGSRAATRSCSGAAARRPRRCARPGSRSRSCPGSPPGVAAPAYAGIPVTHRDAASAVAFVTGHEDPDKPESALDWEALAGVPGNARRLHGRPPAAGDRRAPDRRRPRGRREPAAIVQRGTLPDQRVVRRDARDDRRGRRRRSGSSAPAIAVFGAGRGAARAARLARARGRCAGVPSRSPARGRRPAAWPRGCASSAPRSSRRR